ncbi:MAG TPA: hypothetical protein VNM16_10600 [Bacillota bacterium]|nr:hypothetical protein [Bacillota bacterium]
MDSGAAFDEITERADGTIVARRGRVRFVVTQRSPCTAAASQAAAIRDALAAAALDAWMQRLQVPANADAAGPSEAEAHAPAPGD